ncbi:hypothetical protein [Methylobacterium sp. Leaf91]|uniref:hypothetical protein n=1 Tax=Methylobacterium sp. Leaf91 TaxID=1736247 RepID=UPI0012E8B175|nr:hypothetical protein [Methylobacterium sp. Leaf91]
MSVNTIFDRILFILSTGLIASIVTASPGVAQSNLLDKPPGDVAALCSALSMAEVGIRASEKLAATAENDLELVNERLEDCKWRPLCEHSQERQLLEERRSDANSQRVKTFQLREKMVNSRESIIEKLGMISDNTLMKICSDSR